MDWDKIVTITTIWLIAGASIFVIDWYAIIPGMMAGVATVDIAQS